LSRKKKKKAEGGSAERKRKPRKGKKGRGGHCSGTTQHCSGTRPKLRNTTQAATVSPPVADRTAIVAETEQLCILGCGRFRFF